MSGITDSTSDDHSLDSTVYDTEDEAFSEPIPANLTLVSGQQYRPGQPIELDVNLDREMSSYLPLCLLFNARSIFNKSDNLSELLQQIGPDICIISETFERERKRLDSVLNAKQFKSISYYRKNRAPGGGCAIVYNENRFSVLKLDITAPEEIESCWALFTPRCQDNNLKVKRIAVGSYYISPRSRHKQETIDHINSGPRPLAAYYFGNDKSEEEAILHRTTSGGVCINDVIFHIAQEDMPFGGIGPSGMGSYHGVEGFKTFSHAKSVYSQSLKFNVAKLGGILPPYGKTTEKNIKAQIKR